MRAIEVWLRSMALVIGLFVMGASASASSKLQPRYRAGLHVFTGDDGLPQAGVNSVVQTHDGYLWIGSFGGLARFDGLAFTVFRGKPSLDTPGPKDGAQGGPPSDRVLALHEDDRKQLWIGTQDAGLSIYSQGTFQHLSICGGTCQVNAITQAPDGRLWVASNVGLFNLDPAHKRVSWVDPVRTGHAAMAFDPTGRLYVGGGEGFFVLADRRLRRIALPEGDQWVQMLQADGSDFLVGTDRALYRYEPGQGRWRPLGVAGPTIAVKDAVGRWWVATASGRLVRENGAGEWLDVPELFGMGVTSLAKDDEGNLWLGSGSKGLLRVRIPVFGQIPVFRDGVVMAGRAVVADGQGGLWFGSACGGLNHWRADGAMTRQPLQMWPHVDCVTSLALDRDAALLVGTAEGRLVRIANGKPTPVGVWPGVGAINVWRRGEGRFLVSAGRATFEVWIDGEGRINGQRRIDALRDMSVNNVVPAANGGEWFVGDRGVWRLLDNRIVERWTPQEGLSSRFARALYEDRQTATLWVGTYGGGLNRIRGGQVHHYDTRNGLFDDTVSCILADGLGRLWLGGNRGVTLLPKPRQAAADTESLGYAVDDGLIPSEINGGHSTACHRDGRGRLWFSLVEGFAVIDPADVPQAASVPLRPRIEEVAIAGRMQKIVGSSLALEPNARSLEIHYTAINLSRPRDTYFRFRLRGFDPDWVEAGKNRSILYPLIPWGEHVFEVQARTQGGRWSTVPARLKILNPQPWYLRPWILILATSLGLLVLVIGTQLGAGQERSGDGEMPQANDRRRQRVPEPASR
ncbi:two-component regulator propeller domain-containing protein [Lysobacter gummosus]|uniref:ligand-binding sensor domain-containing protein n=2 Tax=Lysobacter gummosus TaxID=262324 RepID=UPI0036389EE9